MDGDAGTHEERAAPPFLPTLAVGLALAGVACAITLTYLAMRSVLNIGGFCAEGGPYQIAHHCPQGIPGVLMGSIWGGIILAFAYAFAAARWKVPSFVNLLWSALFLALGWNFLEYAFDPPGTVHGVIWGWLVPGILFMLMGGIPLLITGPALVRQFLRGGEQQHGFPGGVPVVHARRAARRIGFTPTGSHLVSDLERLDSLLQSGALTQNEYDSAKRRLLGET